MGKVYYFDLRDKNYKYRLARDLEVQTSLRPATPVRSRCGKVKLHTNGTLLVRKGYYSDGPSGPTVDTRNFMRGAFVHDAVYQLLREGGLPQHCRKTADRDLIQMCREDGMSRARSWWIYTGLRIGGGPAARAKPTHVELAAP